MPGPPLVELPASADSQTGTENVVGQTLYSPLPQGGNIFAIFGIICQPGLTFLPVEDDLYVK